MNILHRMTVKTYSHIGSTSSVILRALARHFQICSLCFRAFADTVTSSESACKPTFLCLLICLAFSIKLSYLIKKTSIATQS